MRQWKRLDQLQSQHTKTHIYLLPIISSTWQDMTSLNKFGLSKKSTADELHMNHWGIPRIFQPLTPDNPPELAHQENPPTMRPWES